MTTQVIHATDQAGRRSHHARTVSIFLLLLVLITAHIVLATPANAHSPDGIVQIYNPLSDGDGVHNDITAKWATTPGTEPANHHIIWSNYGYPNDWSVDIFGPPGRQITTPFGTRTTAGDGVTSRVLEVRPGCASGRVADGGYRVRVAAINRRTGREIGRADIMHVDRPRVSAGQTLGAWTAIGYVGQFDFSRWSSCYQVTSNAGTHVHLEFINRHHYACYRRRPNGANLTELTSIGLLGAQYASRRAPC